MKFPPRRAQQADETMETPHGFQQRGLTLMPDFPVIALPQKTRFFTRLQRLQIGQRAPDLFQQSLLDHSLIPSHVLSGGGNAGDVAGLPEVIPVRFFAMLQQGVRNRMNAQNVGKPLLELRAVFRALRPASSQCALRISSCL